MAIPHTEPGYHVWLEVKIDNNWQILDATWDASLGEVLPINTWEQFGNMKPAVPVIKMIPYDQINVTREPPEDYASELGIERPFLKAINHWLESIRRTKHS